MNQLSTQQIETITKQVYREFPEMKDAKPMVQDQPGVKQAKTPGAASTAEANRFLLTFKGKALGPSGQSIVRIVRVVANERGQVIKISTSK